MKTNPEISRRRYPRDERAKAQTAILKNLVQIELLVGNARKTAIDNIARDLALSPETVREMLACR